MSLVIVSMINFFLLLTGYDPYPSYRSFAIEKSEVVWVQVFEHDSTHRYAPDAVFQKLKAHPWLENVRLDGSEIRADLHDFQVDHRKYEAKFMKTSTVIRTGKWNGKVRIAFKDGRYRVILYGLHYVAIQPERTAGKVSFEAHEITGTLTEWALNDLRTSFKKSVFYNLDLLHLGLKETFTLSDFQVIEENW